MTLRVALGVIHDDLADLMPGGAEDLDALLDGQPLPSIARAARAKLAAVPDLGGELG